jgi:hypothetical protein
MRPSGGPPPRPRVEEEFLHDLVLPYVKPFDETKPEEDPDNYYMEREWRTRISIQFTLHDVNRVIIPEECKGRLRQDVGSYMGQISFA